MSQESRPALRHHDIVFDSDAAPAWDVDSGLDCEDHTFVDRYLASLAESHPVMDRATEGVSEAVPEVLLVAGRSDEVTRHSIHSFSVGSRYDRFQGTLLGFEDYPINLTLLVGRLA